MELQMGYMQIQFDKLGPFKNEWNRTGDVAQR